MRKPKAEDAGADPYALPLLADKLSRVSSSAFLKEEIANFVEMHKWIYFPSKMGLLYHLEVG
jgi:hypothetical protein